MTTRPLDLALTMTPVVERVHGKNHPELTRVRELTEQIGQAHGQEPADQERIDALFTELRQVTSDYAVPADACEGYTGAYEALREADQELSSH